MELTNGEVGVMVLFGLALHYWYVERCFKALERGLKEQHRDTMLTLLRELRWLNTETKYEWLDRFHERITKCDEVIEDPEASEEAKDRAFSTRYSWTEQHLQRFGHEHDTRVLDWHWMIEHGAKVREED